VQDEPSGDRAAEDILRVGRALIARDCAMFAVPDHSILRSSNQIVPEPWAPGVPAWNTTSVAVFARRDMPIGVARRDRALVSW
jgi:hypothetical protein